MTTLNTLPVNALNHLWPYLVKNGDNLAVSAVCRSLADADANFLEKNGNEIFETAQKTDSAISMRIRLNDFHRWEAESKRAVLYRFNDRLRSIISGYQIDLPKHRVLLARDVQLCDKTNEEECDLIEIFKHIVFKRFSPNSSIYHSAEDDDMTIQEIRDWMKGNLEVLQSFPILDLSKDKKIFQTLTSLPKEISLFENLEHLFLEGNHLTRLCPEIERLSKLSLLTLTNNPFPAFPKKIGQLVHQGNGVYKKSNSEQVAGFSLEETIRKITAHQIELIGSTIANRILFNLGTARQYFIAQNIRLKEEAPLSQPELLLMQVQQTAAKIELEKRGINFLSQEKAAIFLQAILLPIKEDIAKALSSPEVFLEYGLEFSLSDYEPVGILADTAKQTGIQINITHVPPKYCTTLRLDKALSQKQSKLVFTLTETSMDTEFSKLTFTLDEKLPSKL